MVVLCLMSLAAAVAAFFVGRRWRPWVRYTVAFAVFLLPVITVATVVGLVGDYPVPDSTTVQSTAQ
jgi:formate hydrogenlyase subunit 3/multisubunit Na+/H+ antiporter MnhD subunit